MIRVEEWRTPGLLPNLRHGPSLFIASDYGGEHVGSRYQSLSFLLADLAETVRRWDPARKGFRSKQKNHRRLSYKKLGDRRRSQMLPTFLQTANEIPGVLVSFLIDRRIESLFEADDGEPCAINRQLWKKSAFEKLLRIAHLGSLLVGGLSEEGQDVLWFTDEDAIVSNIKQHYEATTVIPTVMSGYVPHRLGHFRLGTAKCDDGSLLIEDLLALPDLAAGALAEASTQLSRTLGRVACGILTTPGDSLVCKANEILLWLGQNSHSLKRLTFVVEYVPPDLFKAHMVHLFSEADFA